MPDSNVIDLFFNPKSVAVIGASKNPMKGGHRIIQNLVRNNYKGGIYPVNPNSDGEILGLDFKKSVREIENHVDLAIFYVPNRLIPDLLVECIEMGIPGAIIEASGFEEVGKIGLELRDQILNITDNFSKIRILGPNCMGITRIDGDSDNKTNDKGGFFSSFGFISKYKRGNIAIISQSGMLNGGYLPHLMDQYPEMGIRYSCSIGNKMDLNETEFLEYLLDDQTVNVIAIYLESFKSPRKFIELCKRAKKIPDKTIILVKGGKTEQGQKASLSHTGNLAENYQLIKAIISQSGVIQANSFYELFQFARTFSMMYKSGKKLPIYGNVSMVTGSGGAGTITADITKKYSLNFPSFGDESYKALEDIFPEWMPPNRFTLVDIWPAIEKAMTNKLNPGTVMQKVYKILSNEPEVEGIFDMEFCFSGNRDRYENMVKNFEKISKPIFFWLVGQAEEIRRVSQLLAKNNIPNFPSLEDMIKNFAILVQESKNKKNDLN